MALIVDGAKMEMMMRSPTGPVGRMLIERGTRFVAAARAQAPRKTGCLQDSIVKRFEDHDGELCLRVVSDTTGCSPTRTSYSLYVHEGTAPHVIRARNAPMLAFYWPDGPDGPGMYYFKSVNHPGTRPNRFLTDNLWIFAAPRGA